MSTSPLGKLGHAFWSLYSVVYDTLLVLHPYRHMVSQVSDAVSLEPGARVLDAGCGTGNVTGQLLRAGYRVTAVDASGGMLQRARVKSPHAAVEAVDLNEKLPYPDNSYDAITCSNVLYSLRDPGGDASRDAPRPQAGGTSGAQ